MQQEVIMDHANHTALVTGANAGLGFDAATQLAERGYGHVILACRTIEKAEAARLLGLKSSAFYYKLEKYGIEA